MGSSVGASGSGFRPPGPGPYIAIPPSTPSTWPVT
jgi:hypothetical protein